MLASVVRYADDTAGLEKTLRLLQGFCTIALGFVVSAPQEAAYWIKLRSQLALGTTLCLVIQDTTSGLVIHENDNADRDIGRRYFRLLKWHPCWNSAITTLGSDKPHLYKTLDVCKWSMLAMYFFLEMFTIVSALAAIIAPTTKLIRP